MNAHLRMRFLQRQSGIKDRSGDVEIWLKDNRYRVRDTSGRALYEIRLDITSPRGLGEPAKTIEEMMDRHTPPSGPVVELTGLLGDKDAIVAEQILVGTKLDGLKKHRTLRRFGRDATEYRGRVTVHEDGHTFENAVVRIAAPPFLLFERLHDVTVASVSYEREVTALAIGTVTDADFP